jgi:nitrite reductase (NO-forming)
MTAAPMMHSMDFHSAMVSPQDKYRSVAPGQTISFEFTANYPGVFMYHCGTPMVLEHIASGMYGMMIVEPRNGFPTKVDREYAVVQSEFYTKLDPQKRKVDGKPLYVIDGERVRTKAPTYTVFNGRYNGFVDNPLPAKPGERLRLFVLNVGPSNTSSFHVVGTIFDRVWMEAIRTTSGAARKRCFSDRAMPRSSNLSCPRRATTSWSTTISPMPRRARSD